MPSKLDQQKSPTAGLKDLIERCTKNAKAKRQSKQRSQQRSNIVTDPFKDHPRLEKLRAELKAGQEKLSMKKKLTSK